MPAPLIVHEIDAVTDQRERLQPDNVGVEDRGAG